MKSLASLSLAVIIAMSPAAREAFSQISQVEIMQGTMDLRGTEAWIEATGKKDGALVQVKCRWVNGLPAWISYQPLGVKL